MSFNNRLRAENKREKGHGRLGAHACCVAYYRQIRPSRSTWSLFSPALGFCAMANIHDSRNCASISGRGC